jgi:hypothetical protein
MPLFHEIFFSFSFSLIPLIYLHSQSLSKLASVVSRITHRLHNFREENVSTDVACKQCEVKGEVVSVLN